MITSEETELSALNRENMTSMDTTTRSKAGDHVNGTAPPGELLSESTTKGGRSKGSTIECKDDFQLCFLQAKNYVSTEYNKLQVETEPGKCMKKGVINESTKQNSSDRRCIINMSQLYLHHRIEPKEVQPWEPDLWDIIIIHRELIRIAGLMLCILNNEKSS